MHKKLLLDRTAQHLKEDKKKWEELSKMAKREAEEDGKLIKDLGYWYGTQSNDAK